MSLHDTPPSLPAPPGGQSGERNTASFADQNSDYKVLSGLLEYSESRTSAFELLQRFPSIGHVISAEPSQLHAFGLAARDVALFRLIRETACRMAKAVVRTRSALSNWQALIAYLQTAMAHEQIEQFRILFLDRKNNLIADEVQQRGTVSHTPVYPREVMKRALILNASALIVVHNHPSGDPKPSRDDIEMTRQLKAAANALELELHDHIVIGHGTHASFRSLGLL
jgi:DNA repair protein RadC